MSGFLNIFGKGRGSSSKEDKESKGSKGGGSIMSIGTPTNVVHGIHVSKNDITGDLEGLPRQWQRVMDTLITQDEQQEHPDAVYQAVKFYNYSIKKKDQLEPFKPFITEEAIHEESAEIENYMTKTHHYKSEDSLGKSSTNSSEDNFKELEERPAMPLPLPDVAPLVPPRESVSPPPPIPEKRATTLPPKPKLMPKPKIILTPNNKKNSHLQSGTTVSSSNLDKDKNELSKPLDDLSKISCIEILPVAKKAPQQEQEEEEGELILREKDQSTRKRTPKTDEEVYEELRAICNLDDPTLRYHTKVEVCRAHIHAG